MVYKDSTLNAPVVHKYVLKKNDNGAVLLHAPPDDFHKNRDGPIVVRSAQALGRPVRTGEWPGRGGTVPHLDVDWTVASGPVQRVRLLEGNATDAATRYIFAQLMKAHAGM